MNSQVHYLPLTPGLFSILVLLFAGLIILIQLRILRYAYMRLGVGPGGALLLAVRLADRQLFQYSDHDPARTTGQVGADRRFLRHALCRAAGDRVAGHGARGQCRRRGDPDVDVDLSRAALSALAQGRDRHRRHRLHHPFDGDARCTAIGIAVPVFVPVVATAILAFILSREYAAPLAYIGGSMGTLIGADLLNLDKIGGLGAPVASIGGAGTFDGIFLTGILAVLLAGIASPSRPRPAW